MTAEEINSRLDQWTTNSYFKISKPSVRKAVIEFAEDYAKHQLLEFAEYLGIQDEIVESFIKQS